MSIYESKFISSLKLSLWFKENKHGERPLLCHPLSCATFVYFHHQSHCVLFPMNFFLELQIFLVSVYFFVNIGSPIEFRIGFGGAGPGVKNFSPQNHRGAASPPPIPLAVPYGILVECAHIFETTCRHWCQVQTFWDQNARNLTWNANIFGAKCDWKNGISTNFVIISDCSWIFVLQEGVHFFTLPRYLCIT